MINLEWLRTFRTVYKTKSLSKTAELLLISQPTVSQHISALEAHIGKKLFTRKSKGVLETDDGRILNTMVASSLESLEHTENLISQNESDLKTIITIGISHHLYKTTLCKNIQKLGKYVHVNFGTKQDLIKDVNQGTILYAIVPEEVNTFDTISYPLHPQNIVLAHTPDIDLTEAENNYLTQPEKTEKLLESHPWYAHNVQAGYIKLFWLNAFNKKRPSIVPNYIIPNEYEVLFQLSHGSGICACLDSNLAPFIKAGTLKQLEFPHFELRKLYLVTNKNKTNQKTTDNILKSLEKTASCYPIY